MIENNLDIHPSEVDILSIDDEDFSYNKFQHDLHDKVKNCLMASSIVLDELQLNKLLNELISPVEPFVKQMFIMEEVPERYYEILRKYYCVYPEKFSEIKNTNNVDLLESYQYNTIITLLLHEWLFVHENNEVLKLFPTFLRIIHKLFWIDLNDENKRFYPIFEFFYKELLLSTKLWKGSVIPSLTEIFNLVTKFYFYYFNNTQDELNTELHHFLQFTQTELINVVDQLELPPAHKKIHTLNMFTNELIRHMRHIKIEQVLLSYIHCTRVLDKEVLGRKTKIRLEMFFVDLMTPGTPLYPTRNVRTLSKETVNTIFPNGRRTRTSVNLLFRLLNPFSTLSSWHYWLTRYSKILTQMVVNPSRDNDL
jgi:hypothetical protein